MQHDDVAGQSPATRVHATQRESRWQRLQQAPLLAVFFTAR